jgi:hypothetical protein
MVETLKNLLTHQFDAALCTLNLCIDRCPESLWDSRIGNLTFCQAAFHTVFFADYYLGRGEEGFRSQPFHVEHADFFRDYEELQHRVQQYSYDRLTIQTYVQHCRQKAEAAIAAETEHSLPGPSGFARRRISRAELYVYNLRHVQHHAAQLSLRLRLDAGVEVPWIGSGWQSPSG